MPNIATIGSPKGNISIDKINKGINESISKDPKKEIKLIQAYQ
jgi:hypothetical protein